MRDSTKFYIDKCKMYIDFMLSHGQFSGLSKPVIESWIKNFDSNSDEELTLAYSLLVKFIYFSENDLVTMLEEGVEKLYHNSIINSQIDANFTLSSNALRGIKNEVLQTMLFLPLLDEDSPHESGNYIMRLLVSNNIISSNQSIGYNKLEETIGDKYNHIIIVDDCLGSGTQLFDFWNNYELNNGKTLRSFCAENKLKVTYLVLFGYDKSIKSLNSTFDDLDIVCVRQLSDCQRIFADDSYMWDSNEKRDKYKNLLKTISEENSFDLTGFSEFDFAFAMHDTIPDWSLPLFWKERDSWTPLLRRKNSRD